MNATTTWYVATLVRYVLVEAETEEEAQSKGRAALRGLYAKEIAGHDVPLDVRTVRPATAQEIDLVAWNAEAEARAAARRGR